MSEEGKQQRHKVNHHKILETIRNQFVLLKKKETELKKLKNENRKLSKEIEELGIQEEIVQLYEVEIQTEIQSAHLPNTRFWIESIKETKGENIVPK